MPDFLGISNPYVRRAFGGLLLCKSVPFIREIQEEVRVKTYVVSESSSAVTTMLTVVSPASERGTV